ncbi:MAG: hypothetical protein FWD57_00450 [Polyangiaceae bacterium]|nr:hypothetical protein [Polyangiaceae bacterium]
MNRRIVAVAVSVLAGLAVFGAAGAANAYPYAHDGFFLRLELGAVYMHTTETVSLGSQSASRTIYGGGANLGIMIGGTPADGVVIGGTINESVALSPKVKMEGNSYDTDDDAKMNMLLVGPFVQFYPDDEEGFHFGASIGWSELSLSDSSDSRSISGFGLAGWLGHDWWVDDEWSLGISGRIAYSALSTTESGVKNSFGVITPSILFTATFH